MSFLRKVGAQRVCPKTGKVIEAKSKYRWLRWLFPLTGLAALAWFLIRVIPKPSRAMYPCQRVAFPLASGFLIWLTGALGSVAAYRKAIKHLRNARYVVAGVCIIISVAFIFAAVSTTFDKKAAAAPYIPQTVNDPIGVAQGVNPGRVAWIHDPEATDWDGPGTGDVWHESIDQTVVNEMMSEALRAMTGESSDQAAWDSIFRWFNQKHGKGNVGYTPGEKISFKINNTLCFGASAAVMDKPAAYVDNIDNAPQLAIAILKQLIDVVGVNPGDISIGDPGRIMPNYWYGAVVAECPGVVYLTYDGYAGSWRTITTWSSVEFHWSDPCTARTSGVVETDHIPTHYAEAEYFINCPILKSHQRGVPTVCGKNHYGSLIRNPNASRQAVPTDWYDMHNTLPDVLPGMANYCALVDLMTHPQLGGKTLLYLVDGLFASEGWDGVPSKWQMAPFGNDWCSSIFLSQDGVAVDSVAFDFLMAEWPKEDYINKDGADNYLHELALLPSPPSGTTYDPNDDGGLTESFGVHEHWNNATDMQYTRNLGTGDGIELASEPGVMGDFDKNEIIDFRDFAVLAAAYGSTPGYPEWNAECDMSMPSDNVIDDADVAVFCENWLEELFYTLIEPGATLEQVYYASGKYFEGPVWDPVSGKLYFTNRTDNQTMRLDAPGSASVWATGLPYTNGMYLSLEGRMLRADENPMQISSHLFGASGPEDSQVLADSSDGISTKPNDLVQVANGNIYFTGPDWGAGPSAQGIYLLKTDGTVTMVKNGLYQPNGCIAGNDGSKLYVSESSSSNNSLKRWWVFNIQGDGTLDAGSVFYQPSSPASYNDPDGMTIDALGNLYCTGFGGLWIFSREAELLTMIPIPEAASNVTFGGTYNKTLYITCQDKVYSLAMAVTGGGHGGTQLPSQPTIPATAAEITVDGTIELAWNSAPSYDMDNILLGTVSDDSDLSGTWKALWDWENLYFLVEITDDVQYNDSPSSTPWEDDVVELYIDADHSQGASYDGTNDYELVFRWNDPGVIHLGVYSATNTTGMDFVIVDTATGYRFEAALPWSAMGVTPVGGNYIGLDVHTCDDDDGGNREAKKAWWAQTDDSWQWPNIFASVLLTGASEPPVPPGQASNPSPTGTSVGINSDLSWTAGTNATSHDVYFGTDSTPDPGEFQDNQPGTTFEPGTLEFDTTYYWRIDEKNAVGTTTGIVWSFTTASEPGPLPSPWISYDIDSPGAAGSASYSSGVFTVSGSGADIAGTSDAGQFVYQPVSGNCTIIARVVGLTDVVANWAKAGIMFRESLDPNSTFAYGNYTTNIPRSVNSWTLLHRDTTGGGATQTVWGNVPPPYWLRVVRSGNNFSGYVSSDGSSWSLITTVNIPMTSSIYVGMAVTSHQAGSLSTATFDNVSVTP